MGVKTVPPAPIADGATGREPSDRIDGCDARPRWDSWMKMRPPSACTASVTSRQPAIWASLNIPGRVGGGPPAIGSTSVDSETISPADARCA